MLHVLNNIHKKKRFQPGAKRFILKNWVVLNCVQSVACIVQNDDNDTRNYTIPAKYFKSLSL